MKKAIIPVVVLIALLIAWQALVRLFSVPLYVLPAPTDIFAALIDIMPQLWPHFFTTLYETVLGILLSVALGVIIALLMDAFNKVKLALYPLLAMTQAIPILVIAPLLIIYLGFGVLPKVFTVVLMCFFPITINLTAALAGIDQNRKDLLLSLGATRAKLYRFLLVPSALPGFFSGLRISCTYSVTGAVVGEWLSSQQGLGFYMLRVKNAYMLDKVFAIIVVIILLSLLLLGLAVALERIAMPYRYKKPVY